MEIWKPIEGMNGFYEVSNLGAVRSFVSRGRNQQRRVDPKLMRLSRRKKDGYLTVDMSAGGKRKKASVHCLAAAAFIGPRPMGLDVAHLNGNPADNRVGNLAYVTRAENESHKVGHGTALNGEKSINAKLTELAVKWIRRMHSEGHAILDIALAFRVAESTVHSIVAGEAWTHV
jgi:hypothetical protein